MISFFDIYSAIALFMVALTVHIFWWRCRIPPREMVWLIMLFLVAPIIVLGGLACVELTESTLSTVCAHFLIRTLLLTSLSLIYIMTYPPIQAGCPSLKIILAISKSGKGGMSHQEIQDIFPEETMFSDRFDDLVNDGLVSWHYDSWGISAAGRGLAAFFRIFRKLLGMPLGEG